MFVRRVKEYDEHIFQPQRFIAVIHMMIDLTSEGGSLFNLTSRVAPQPRHETSWVYRIIAWRVQHETLTLLGPVGSTDQSVR